LRLILRNFLKKKLSKEKKMTFKKNGNNVDYDVPYLDLNDKLVWGATSVILNEFRKLIDIQV
jgi:hypothetical protein